MSSDAFNLLHTVSACECRSWQAELKLASLLVPLSGANALQPATRFAPTDYGVPLLKHASQRCGRHGSTQLA